MVDVGDFWEAGDLKDGRERKGTGVVCCVRRDWEWVLSFFLLKRSRKKREWEPEEDGARAGRRENGSRKKIEI